MIFKKGKNKVGKGIKKVDNIVTWLIIWWAVVSIFWLSKTKKWKRITGSFINFWKNLFKFWYSSFWKTIVKIISFLWKK